MRETRPFMMVWNADHASAKKKDTQIPGGRKTVKSKNGENLVFSRGGVTLVTPFPFS